MFVHGCFWHAHATCPMATVPKRNRKFWAEKFAANRARDARVARTLRQSGFRVVTVWQREVEKHPARVARRLARRLAAL